MQSVKPTEEPEAVATREEEGICNRIAKSPLELEFLEPMPEKIDFMTIPKINEIKAAWKTGMKKVEDSFKEHMKSIGSDFEDRVKQVLKIQLQIEHNLAWIDRHYVAMQKKLNEKHSLIHEERESYEAEKAMIKAKVGLDSPIVKLNVGGKTHL